MVARLDQILIKLPANLNHLSHRLPIISERGVSSRLSLQAGLGRPEHGGCWIERGEGLLGRLRERRWRGSLSEGKQNACSFGSC